MFELPDDIIDQLCDEAAARQRTAKTSSERATSEPAGSAKVVAAVETGSAPVSSAGLWNYELHEDYYVLNRGDVQVGILFPDSGMPVGYIRHLVATLNAYYPTEPGTRWPCGKPEASAGPMGLPNERQPEPNNLR